MAPKVKKGKRKTVGTKKERQVLFDITDDAEGDPTGKGQRILIRWDHLTSEDNLDVRIDAEEQQVQSGGLNGYGLGQGDR